MVTEIYVERRRMDVSADISSLLTFAIDDVKDFASRQTTFSKTVVAPGTNNNNALFGNIFETGISNDYDPLLDNIGYNFNAAKSAKCIVFQDNLQTFKGTIRMLKIIKDKTRIEYEMALNGELTSLNVALSGGLLTDLDFSAYNQLWNAGNINTSWSNPGGTGVYFPMIDYGTYSTDKHNWDFRTFRPALYVKEYIDKIFTAANFRYSSTLFNTTRFKKLIIPHNQKKLTKLTSTILTATRSTTYQILDRTSGPTQSGVTFTSIIGGLFTVSGSKIFTYTGATTLLTTLNFHVDGTYHLEGDPTDYSVEITIKKNGVFHYFSSALILNDTFSNTYNRTDSIPLTLATGDSIELYFQLQGGPGGPAEVFVDNASLSIASATTVSSPLDYDEMIEMNQAIPQNVRQVDFLVSLVKLFNLYVFESPNDDRKIFIEPYVNFYNGTVVDWTYKMNRDSPIQITPLSEINSKIYNFNYKDDTDYYNDLYKKRYNQGYGSHIFDSEFEFASQTNKLELIFAPTPLVGYVGEDKVYPTIFKRTGPDSLPVEETIDSVIRIMQTKMVIGVAPWDIVNGATSVLNPTYYGYAGHFDDPMNPDNDLNFGLIKELFYTLSSGNLLNTQFNVFWSVYMAEITDKDSKMLTAKFYLTPIDIYNLSFARYVYVDGVLYRLNKITDYNATYPTDCEVQLLKVINSTYTYPPGSVPDELLWIDYDTVNIIDSDNETIPYI